MEGVPSSKIVITLSVPRADPKRKKTIRSAVHTYRKNNILFLLYEANNTIILTKNLICMLRQDKRVLSPTDSI